MTSILNGNRFIYAGALPEDKFLPRTCRCAGLLCFIYHFGQPSNKLQLQCNNCRETTLEVRTVQTTPGARSATRKVTLLEMKPASTIQNLHARLFLLLGHPMFSPIFTPVRLRYLALYTNLRNMPTNTSRLFVVGTYQRRRRSNQRTRLLLQNKSGKGFLPFRVLNL